MTSGTDPGSAGVGADGHEADYEQLPPDCTEK